MKKLSLIIPLVLCVVALFEQVVTYKVRQHVHDVYWRAAIVLVLTGLGFAIAAGWIAPWLAEVLRRLRYESHSDGGTVGLWVFYALIYGVVFYAYYVVERSGPGGLLPPSWR